MIDRKNWEVWHTQYDIEDSDLSGRLEVVQRVIRKSLPQNPKMPFTILDICAGDGRDLSGALHNYTHKDLIQGLLVEINPNLATTAKNLLKENGLYGLETIVEDASEVSLYTKYIPADLVLLCGIFGNISNEDIETTINNLSSLCKQNANVIWTRNRREPDATPWIRKLFKENGFQEKDFIAPDSNTYAVGVNRFTGEYLPYNGHRKLFTFLR